MARTGFNANEHRIVSIGTIVPNSKPVHQDLHNKLMAFPIGMVTLRHQVLHTTTIRDIGPKFFKTVGQSDTVRLGKIADQLGMPIQRVLGITQIGAKISRGGQKNYLDAAGSWLARSWMLELPVICPGQFCGRLERSQ